MTDAAPAVVTRYLAAADAQDPAAVAACFAEDGTATDEGVTYRGREEIAGWREKTLSQWTYTTVLTGSEPISPSEYRVTAHISGDFPGGEADLTFHFTLGNDQITALTIG
jgi:uncharacterized protein (TIGR02246 family)